MRIGLTFDLATAWAAAGVRGEDLAEFDAPETIGAVEGFFVSCGHEVVRIGGAQDLVQRLAQGERWDLVFNICEGRFGTGREALVPALLDAYQVPYTFSDPLTLALALDKALTKRVFRDAGLPTAPFAVLTLETPLSSVDLAFPLFVKPAGEGTGKGIGGASFCRNMTDLARTADHLFRRFGGSVLAETWLPGREFTVGVLGRGGGARMIGVMEIFSGTPYGFDTKKHYEGRVSYRLVDDPEARVAGKAALAAWRLLGGRDGGRIDLKSDAAGRPMLLEVNPLAGLHPVDSDLVILARFAGHPYAWLIEQIFTEACLRSDLSAREGGHSRRIVASGAAALDPRAASRSAGRGVSPGGSVTESPVSTLERADRA